MIAFTILGVFFAVILSALLIVALVICTFIACCWIGDRIYTFRKRRQAVEHIKRIGEIKDWERVNGAMYPYSREFKEHKEAIQMLRDDDRIPIEMRYDWHRQAVAAELNN